MRRLAWTHLGVVLAAVFVVAAVVIGVQDCNAKKDYIAANARRALTPYDVFVSFACTFGAKEWGGYARSGDVNFALRGRKSLSRKEKHMDNVLFRCAPFGVWTTPPSVYYCDPPYKNTTGYKTGDFDHSRFHTTCETLASQGHDVFVSEFVAPEHWPVVWSKERSVTVSKGSYHKRTDKLFRVVPRVKT